MNHLDLSTPLGVTLALLPEVLLSVSALVVLLFISWRHETAADSRLAGWLSFGGILVSGAGLAALWVSGVESAGPAQMIALDPFRYASAAIFLLSAGITILLSLDYLEREQCIRAGILSTHPVRDRGDDVPRRRRGHDRAVPRPRGHVRRHLRACRLRPPRRIFGRSGTQVLPRRRVRLGILLYGIALIYGSTGATNLAAIGAALSEIHLPMIAALGLGLLLIGLGFKVAAVPFHMWAPDVYDGAPTPVTGFMATGVKAAAFVALARVLMECFPSAQAVWQPVIAVLAIVTMVVGNLVALAQRSLKRMLAYSSVAHAGYLLVALWPGTQLGAGAVLLYLLAYGMTTLATFGILATLGQGGERDVTYEDIAGLAAARPWLAFALSVCMLSLLGFPGTFGFIGKWSILSAVISEGQTILAVVLVLTSVLSAGYYLPVIMAVYMKPAGISDTASRLRLAPAAVGVIAFSIVVLLLFGFWPSEVLDLATRSAESISQVVYPVAKRP